MYHCDRLADQSLPVAQPLRDGAVAVDYITIPVGHEQIVFQRVEHMFEVVALVPGFFNIQVVLQGHPELQC